jgi:uncharacterized membrane protein YdjX (TVP38/TMEM64 family)
MLLPGILAGLFVAAENLGLREWTLDREAVEAWLSKQGSLAPLLFVICYSFLPLIFIPRALLALIGGYLFGWPSVLYTWTGALIGETIAFGLAMTLGRSLIQKASLRNARAQRAVLWLKAEGFWAVLMMRLFPFMPTDVVNFGSGAAGVRYRDFAAGTLMGILPGCIVFSYYGQLFGGEPLELLYSIPLFLAPMLLAFGVARWRYGPAREPVSPS